mgnify:CR=1 FL=1
MLISLRWKEARIIRKLDIVTVWISTLTENEGKNRWRDAATFPSDVKKMNQKAERLRSNNYKGGL